MSITRSAKATNTKAVKVKSTTPSNPKQGVARVSKPAVKPSQKTAPLTRHSKPKASPPSLNPTINKGLANVKPGSKQQTLYNALSQPCGASIAELITATGWQAHSIRGAISAVLRKQLGLTVSHDKDCAGVRRYRIQDPL
jgi:hypothetical protein